LKQDHVAETHALVVLTLEQTFEEIMMMMMMMDEQ
jgi:hypothetical protein